MEYIKWSEWRKWDLHFHTPSSYDYWDKSITNQDIINKLKENDIAVVAITDHHIIDITRIRDLQLLWKKENITVLPWIEFLTESRWSVPIHFIWIFWENSNIEHIWGQLENNTNIKKIKWEWKKINEVYCKLEDTIRLVKELWGITTIHAGEKSNSIENITHSLPHLEAQKTDIVTLIDIFELWKADDQRWYRDIVFPAIKKTIPMIICSDNHNVNKFVLKQNCWIKADPTFEWLKQIIYEPEDRVYIWEKPDVLERVKNNKTKYIKSLKIGQVSWYDEKKWVWFKDQQIEFNKELVAIIWNKWNGKSAIADIIGLLGNTYNDKDFSFLHKERFYKDSLATGFEWYLEWENWWVLIPKNLASKVNPSDIEKVRYLPQSFFNTLTTDLRNKGFKDTLENVIFQHLDSSLKMGKYSFEELKKYKTSTINEEIELKKQELIVLNEMIVKLEKKRLPEYLDKVNNSIKEKEIELGEKEKNLEELQKNEVKNPNEDLEGQKLKSEHFQAIEKMNISLKEIESKIEWEIVKKWKLEIQREELNNFLNGLIKIEQSVWKFKKDNGDKLLTEFGINIDDIVSIKTSNGLIEDKIKHIVASVSDIDNLFLTKEQILILPVETREQLEKASLLIQKQKCLDIIEINKKALTKQEQEYQAYLENKNKIEKSILETKWGKDKIDTLEYFQNQKFYLENNLWKELLNLTKRRLDLSAEIYSEKQKIIDLYRSFKEPIDKKVEVNKEYLADDYTINIDVKFIVNDKFSSTFLKFINQWRVWSFNGKTEGESILQEIISNKDLYSIDSIKSILNSFIEHLEYDKRPDGRNEARVIFNQVNEPEEFYNYIFWLDYLEPEYELKSWEKSLESLSPWEKWTLLLIFYLMIDEEGIPLIIDQPEDNLDNQSVFKMLTRFVKIAKKQRQIIIVTHNPNLAVGADAEQIIYVKIDKENNNVFLFKSWSIENPEINGITVDILEWTMPAFDKRRLKYKRK